MSDEKLREGAIPLRERRTLDEEWRDFDRQCIPPTAPELQRVEMKRAWYAGAATFFSLAGDLDSEPDATELDLAYVTSLENEIKAFAIALSEGRA
jgi:hypothetical protein